MVALGAVLGAAVLGGAPGAAAAGAASLAVVGVFGGARRRRRAPVTGWVAGALAGGAGLLVAAAAALAARRVLGRGGLDLVLIAAVSGGAVGCAARPNASTAARRGEDSPTRAGVTPGGPPPAVGPRHP